MLKNALVLNQEFHDTINYLENSKEHVFVTGRAGTGKSTLLELFKSVTKKNVVALAPTGIAALNIQGQTVHSFFNFPPRLMTQKDIKEKRNKKLYQKIDAIIIDEISMLRADIIDNIDLFLRLNGKSSSTAFGGIQMIFFGDLFQLPPVLTTEEAHYFNQQYKSPYFFSANVFRHNKIRMIELSEVFRQKDKGFVRLLDAIRTNSASYEEFELINSRYNTDLNSDENSIILTSKNQIANAVNLQKLNKINDVAKIFNAETTGIFPENIFPTEHLLVLKVGAQVICIKNDPAKQYVNGTIGSIISFDETGIKIVVKDDEAEDKIVTISRAIWEQVRYSLDNDGNLKQEIIGTFKQYPLKLAWAITIHKSQGQSFDKVRIDLGSGAFAPGQTYVALSRCRKLEGISLHKKIRPTDVFVDEAIVDFMQSNR